MAQAIIIVQDYGVDPADFTTDGCEGQYAVGPFDNGDEANRYGFNNFEGKVEWYWLPLCKAE